MADFSHSIVTRAGARASGLKHYFTGRACKKGHIELRVASTGDCSVCSRERSERQRRANPERMRAYREKWALANPEKAKASMAKHRAEHRDSVRARGAEWKAKNPDKVRAARIRRYHGNADRFAAEAREWRKANPDKARAVRQRSHAKRATVPQFRLEAAIRAGLVQSLPPGAKAGRKTWLLLGYSRDDLRTHLEAQFRPGMTWENYGDWHVDHVVPLAAFNYDTPEHIDFRRAWALSNLQPLWATDNHRKGARLAAPFQPSLAI